jgi:hypothetical protein
MFNWNKKEKPFASYGGFGGGGLGLFGGSASIVKASGGDVNALEPGNGYVYHTFTTLGSGTFTVTKDLTAEILVVAGGGGGGMVDGGAGGGGAGGVAHCTSLTLSAGTYPLTVGAGDPVSTSSGGGVGTPSVFYGPAPTTSGRITALGGGQGGLGPRTGGAAGTAGGSGGGGQGFQSPGAGGPGTQPAQSNPPNTANYGSNGRTGPTPGGGGGGAGPAPGNNADGVHGKQLPGFLQPLAFNPPHPYTSQPRWETSGYYGGGGSTNPGNPNPLGGGGVPGSPDPAVDGEPGVNGLGGGGGTSPLPGFPTVRSGDGGHGVIIIRYQ